MLGANLIIRGFQLVFSAIVLGLSISLIRGQVWGGAPSQHGYAAFTGGFGCLTALIGFAACFVEAIPAFIMAALDGLASIVFLAGGIAVAVALKRVNCSVNWDDKSVSNDASTWPLGSNNLINGGFRWTDNGDGNTVRHYQIGSNDPNGRCRMNYADDVFMFFALIASAAALVITLIAMRRGGGRKGVVV